jgi:hypothetical protein
MIVSNYRIHSSFQSTYRNYLCVKLGVLEKIDLTLRTLKSSGKDFPD